MMNQIVGGESFEARSAGRRGAGRRRGFTMVELLVVIGIIALLISILLPTLNKARHQALVTRCKANLSSVGKALQVYAAGNRGRLPVHPGGGTWLWDVSIDTRNALVNSGGQRQTLYCAVYDEQDQDGLWDFNPTYSVLGYYFLTKRLGGNFPPTLVGKNYQETLVPKPDPTKGVQAAASTELVTDAVISSSGYFGGAYGGWAYAHRSSHMNGQNKPEGGNILYMDGHVDWRDFVEMKIRGSVGGIEFWF